MGGGEMTITLTTHHIEFTAEVNLFNNNVTVDKLRPVKKPNITPHQYAKLRKEVVEYIRTHFRLVAR